METGPLSWNIYVSVCISRWMAAGKKSVANGGRDIGTNASARPCMQPQQQDKQSRVQRIQWRRMEMLEMMMMMAEERWGKTTVTVEWKSSQNSAKVHRLFIDSLDCRRPLKMSKIVSQNFDLRKIRIEESIRDLLPPLKKQSNGYSRNSNSTFKTDPPEQSNRNAFLFDRSHRFVYRIIARRSTSVEGSQTITGMNFFPFSKTEKIKLKYSKKLCFCLLVFCARTGRPPEMWNRRTVADVVQPFCSHYTAARSAG